MGYENLDDQDIARFDNMAEMLAESGLFRIQRRVEPVSHYGLNQIEDGNLATALIVDTETTGLAETDVPIEMGMILVEFDKITGQLGKVLGSYQGLEQPNIPVSKEAYDVHGIGDEDLAGQVFDDEQVNCLIARADFIVSHNAEFDRMMSQRRFPEFSSKIWLCSVQDIPWKEFGYKSRKLESLLLDTGYFHDAHRAVEDCNALAYVLSRPCLVDVETGVCVFPMACMLESANNPQFRIGAMNASFESKDALKSNGYMWDANSKCWFKNLIGQRNLDTEVQWLKEQIYKVKEGRRVNLKLAQRSGMSRHDKSILDEVVAL